MIALIAMISAEGADLRSSIPGRVAVMALVTAATLAVPAAAHAAAEPDPVLNKAVFNDPAGTVAQQYTIYQQTARLIDRIPADGELRMSMYHLDPPVTADTADQPDLTARLKKAYDRGVAVKIVVDQASNDFTAVQALRGVLGTDDTAESFIVSCNDYFPAAKRGCIGTRTYQWPAGPVPAYNHNKFIAISKLTLDDGSTADGVVWQASSNLTRWDADEGYNNALTLADSALHNEYVKYHKDLVSHRRSATGNNNYYKDTGNVSQYRAFFYPRQENATEGFTGSATDNIVSTLNGVTCIYKDDQGVTRQADIRIMALEINRTPIATKLAQLRQAGCWVDVVATTFSSSVIAALDAGGVQKTRCNWENPADADLDYRVHHKYMLIEALYSGDTTPRTYTGSHNLTWSALRQADEALIRVAGKTMHDDYLRNFWSVRDTCRARTPQVF